MVEELIGRLDLWLAANRPDYYALLQPGATDAELDAFEAQIVLKLPAAFRALYRWRSGQWSFKPIQMNWTFMTLEEVRSAKAELDSMIGHDFEDLKYWRRGRVPFLHNGAGSHLCVDLTAEEGGRTGQLIDFWKQDQDRPVVFASVEAWLADLVASQR